jgi:nucleoside-diphosphate-sugar epimerase
MRIVVVGAGGFIGRHLCKALDDGENVVERLDITASRWHKDRPEGPDGELDFVDIRDDKYMEELAKEFVGFDACVHLAAIASPDVCRKNPAQTFATNVMGTHNVWRMCQAAGIPRAVFMSSAHVYGISPKYIPTPEEHPLSPLDVYTVSKIMGESICELFWDSHRISYCAIRLYNAFGSGQSNLYFLGAKLEQAKNSAKYRKLKRDPSDLPVTIRNADISKDWTHVDDAVRAIEAAVRSDFVGPVNVGTGVETKLGELAQHIAESFDVPLQRDPDDGTGPTRMCAEIARARQVLHWEPKVSVRDGLDRLIEEAKASQ